MIACLPLTGGCGAGLRVLHDLGRGRHLQRHGRDGDAGGPDPLAGAAFFFLLREGFSRFFTEYYLIPVGIISLMVIFMPQGFLGFLRRSLNR